MAQTILPNSVKNEIRRIRENYTHNQLAEMYGVSSRTISRITSASEDFPVDPDELAIIEENVRYKKNLQRVQDKNRIENKAFREHARVENAVSEFYKQFVSLLKTNTPSTQTIHHTITTSGVGIIHLSDVHFNEQIDLSHNKYNFEIASKRLRKLVQKALKAFSTEHIGTVVVAMTGDMFNSDRRLDELLTNATNRSSAVFIGFDIIRQLILEINEKYNVVVASVSGNEGRVGKDVGWGMDQALDNYDIVLHNMLRHHFHDCAGVEVADINDPLECVLEVAGQHILLIHGHNGTANTKLIDSKVGQYQSKYANRGIKIDYVIMGHIHQAFVSDYFARNGGLPGSNEYSDKALNLESKASQNFYIIEEDGSIHGTKVDLQNCEQYKPYEFNRDLACYNTRSAKKVKEQNGVVIHQVVI